MSGEDNKPIQLILCDMTVQTDDEERLMPPYWCVRHDGASKASMAREEMTVQVIVHLLSKDKTRGEDVRGAEGIQTREG